MAETSTSDAAFIVVELSKKLAFASHALMQKAKANADLRVKRASKRLSLEERLNQAKAEVQSLRDENKQLNCKCSKLETTASDNEKVLESLRNNVENDTNEKSALNGSLSWRRFTLMRTSSTIIRWQRRNKNGPKVAQL